MMGSFMKKTTKKLELKTSTVRMLQSSELSGAVGGGISNNNGTCSDSCTSCDTCTDCYETACECVSVYTWC